MAEQTITNSGTYDLSRLTTFKIGGKCDAVYFPKSVDEFIELFNKDNTLFVIGSGSNLLISSQGIKGGVVCTKQLKNITVVGNTITAEAGVTGAFMAQLAAKEGLSGVEFFIAFPGSIGGNVFMNASAHNQFTSDCFVSARCYDRETKSVVTLKKSDMNFAYKQSILQTGRYILLDAVFELKKAPAEEINALMARNLTNRKQTQPSMAYPNAGCAFKNPPNDSAGRLLDKAGMKGYDDGNVRIWDTHANFIINKGNATSTDVLELMLKMYNKVKETYSIELTPEVIYVGEMSKREEEICRILYPKIQK